MDWIETTDKSAAVRESIPFEIDEGRRGNKVCFLQNSRCNECHRLCVSLSSFCTNRALQLRVHGKCLHCLCSAVSRRMLTASNFAQSTTHYGIFLCVCVWGGRWLFSMTEICSVNVSKTLLALLVSLLVLGRGQSLLWVLGSVSYIVKGRNFSM